MTKKNKGLKHMPIKGQGRLECENQPAKGTFAHPPSILLKQKPSIGSENTLAFGWEAKPGN